MSNRTFVFMLKGALAMQNIVRTAVVLTLCVLGAQALSAQNPHERLMERAHPTPTTDPSYDFDRIMVPLITGERVFPSRFTNSNMIIEENDPLPVQNESSIAINPLDPNNLIGSAVDYRNGSTTKAYYSVDGGKTWQNVDLGQARPGWRSSNDPSVAFDHLGRGYLCYGGFNRQGNAQFGENGVFVSLTDDGGQTWDTKHIAVIIHTGQQTADSAFEDKYYVHVDTASSSLYRGRLYIPWKRVINSDSSTGIVIARSTDRGLTWLEPVAVSDRFPSTSEDTTFGQSFPLARTGPDGSVHLVWNSGTESSVRYARSTDGGDTWTEPRILHTYEPFGNKSEVAGQVNSRVKEVVRAEAYPTLTIDNTGGPNNGNLYLCWSADQVPSIYFSRSTDNGETWSDPVTVHSDDRNDQFWPWIALDPTNGDVAVMYFDSRDDAENILVNAYVSLSTDGGLTWTDKRVGDDQNDLRRNPFQGNTFAGDYNGCDFYNGMVYPSWVDMRNTYGEVAADNDVYTAIVNVRAPAAPDRFAATTLPEVRTEIQLDWSETTERSFGQPIDDETAHYVLRREGTIIAEPELSTLEFRDTGLEEFREYQYTLVAVSGEDTSAVRRASAFAGGSRAPGIPGMMALEGSEGQTMTITATLPRTRLDGITALVNLAAIDVEANGESFQITVNPTDTGKTADLQITTKGAGWYRVTTRSVDADGNNSPWSDTLIAYNGSLEWMEETFDTMPALWRISGDWDRVDFNGPNTGALTDSPGRPYTARARDTVMLYPRRLAATIPDGSRHTLTYRIAAFVEERDSAIIEYAWDQQGPWLLGKTYDETVFPRWDDTTKSEDAWLSDSFILDGPFSADTVYLRLRMASNISQQSDGMYIDDISFGITTSVDEGDLASLRVYPQPAASNLMIALPSEGLVSRCTILALDGSIASASWSQYGHTVAVDTRALSSGVYHLRLEWGQRVFNQLIQIVR